MEILNAILHFGHQNGMFWTPSNSETKNFHKTQKRMRKNILVGWKPLSGCVTATEDRLMNKRGIFHPRLSGSQLAPADTMLWLSSQDFILRNFMGIVTNSEVKTCKIWTIGESKWSLMENMRDTSSAKLLRNKGKTFKWETRMNYCKSIHLDKTDNEIKSNELPDIRQIEPWNQSLLEQRLGQKLKQRQGIMELLKTSKITCSTQSKGWSLVINSIGL